MSDKNVDVKRKDRNNFISVILTKISLAKNFKQRVAMTITSKLILKHITLRFYLRKRYNTLFLYIRPKDNFGSVVERHRFYLDLKTLIPKIELESTKGHYTGLLLELTEENNDSLILLLKLIAMLAHPEDFYSKESKIYRSYFNYPETSHTPIHFNFTRLKMLDIHCHDLIHCMLTEVQPKHEKQK